MRILVQHKGYLRRFFVLKSSDRDGSLTLVVRREGVSASRASWSTKLGKQVPQQVNFEVPLPKSKRITIHQSGRVNYHENGRKIFIEPLTRTTRASCIYGYRVPALDKLDLYTDQISEEDAVLDLSDSGDGPVSFLVFIGPADFVPLGKAIKLTYDAEGYSVAISVDGAPFQVPTGYETHFITFTPEEGHFLKQQMAEDQAMIAYHQAIIGSTEPILYQPNGDGVIRLIFSVQLRADEDRSKVQK